MKLKHLLLVALVAAPGCLEAHARDEATIQAVKDTIAARVKDITLAVETLRRASEAPGVTPERKADLRQRADDIEALNRPELLRLQAWQYREEAKK